MSAEAAKEMASNVADRIANEWMLEGRKLDIDEQRLLKEWIYGGLQQISGLIDSGTGAYKVFAKGAQQVIRKLTEKSGNNELRSSTTKTRTSSRGSKKIRIRKYRPWRKRLANRYCRPDLYH